MNLGYSPYAAKKQGRESLRVPLGPRGHRFRRWIFLVLGFFLFLFFLFYLWLGELRFFANHYFGLTFFRNHYLILLQNNYELRPGGGFISAYGVLDTFLGFPTNLQFYNVYDIDTDHYIKPPYPQEDFLKDERYQGYNFRDANWQAHFPDSAKELIDFYQKKFPEREVDGIAVMNFSMIEDWIYRLGGLNLQGIRLTDQNIFSWLEFSVNNIDRHNEKTLAERKNILAELAPALTSKAKWNLGTTKSVIVEALREKDLYFWFKSNRLQKAVGKRGWGNTLKKPERSDFLAVNIANLGSKKADRYLTKEVYHTVNLTKEIPEITTEVELRFPGFLNNYSDHYKGYVRLYLPKEATLDQSPVDSVTSDEGEFKVVGTKVVLPAGSKTVVSYTYTLPRTYFDSRKYALRVIRQSGAEVLYNFTVETPRDTLLNSPDFLTRENRANFQGMIRRDQDFTVSILPDTLPPYALEHLFTDLNTIQIYWNEPISASEAQDISNYQIADMNFKDPDVTDTPKVVSAEIINASEVRLTLQGVTRQPLERYQVEIRNLTDLAGNIIQSNPKILTAVQRYNETVKTNNP